MKKVKVSKSNKPSCPSLKFGKAAGCRFCSLQAGGPSSLCFDMLKIWQVGQKIELKAQQDAEWLLSQAETTSDYLKLVGVANEIIDEAKETFNKLETKEVHWTNIAALKSEDLIEERSE